MDGDYEIQIRLMRDRDEHVEASPSRTNLELLFDRTRVQLFTSRPRRASRNTDRRSTLEEPLPVKAGPHALVCLRKKPSLLLETARQPYHARFTIRHREPSPRSISPIVVLLHRGPGNSRAASGSSSPPSTGQKSVPRARSSPR